MQTIFSSYGEALSTYLKENGIKQSYISEKTGKGKDEISNYVRGKVMPNPESQRLLGDLLGIHILQVAPTKWEIVTDPATQKAISSMERSEDLIQRYIAQGGEVSRDDLPKLLEIRDKFQELIDKLVERK